MRKGRGKGGGRKGREGEREFIIFLIKNLHSSPNLQKTTTTITTINNNNNNNNNQITFGRCFGDVMKARPN